MSDKTSLGDRMKGYENGTRLTLATRTPVIIRIDGKAFHTFTRRIVAQATGPHHLKDPSLAHSPFSQTLHRVMSHTATMLVDNIQTAVLAYTQSDEISILLRDWDNPNTQQWFGGTVQKIVSVSASIATAVFNERFQAAFDTTPDTFSQLALFDSRTFNLPREEVANYFIWRQQDAVRNSIQMYGRHFFSQKEMHGKHNQQVLDMLVAAGHAPWEHLPNWARRGTTVYRTAKTFMGTAINNATITDFMTPLFTENRQFIEEHLTAQQEEKVDER